MAIQVRCPHCSQIQLPNIRVKTLGPPDGAKGTEDPHKTLHVMLVLLLSLTIIGLPLAHWLCRRFEQEYPIRVGPALQYSYQCGQCGYKWTTRTDQPVPRSTTGNLPEPHEGISPVSSPPEGTLNSSAL